jgi:hypothetical protein
VAGRLATLDGAREPRRKGPPLRDEVDLEQRWPVEGRTLDHRQRAAPALDALAELRQQRFEFGQRVCDAASRSCWKRSGWRVRAIGCAGYS